MKDWNGREQQIRTVLKWLRGQRKVSFQWLRRQYKGVETGKYTMEEWTKFLVESKTISRTLPHVSAITPEWTLLEREWLVETLIKRITKKYPGKKAPLRNIEYGIELYYMLKNFATDLFLPETIVKLRRVVTIAIYHVERVEDQCKLMGVCNRLFKEPVEAMKANNGVYQYENKKKNVS